jgi:deazaflavin-dependent oxidoreductase (nitroreductase family)
LSKSHASVEERAGGPAAAPNLPPRVLVRTAWLLHRSAYRVTGGRFGLSRPQAGSKFGMLRLTTIGRRSGQTRVAIVGYYEDGPNLVTLAMNGWGDRQPAWWLNLQAHPETTVEVPGASRPVRARAAVGEERGRLWAKFRDYPGWGDDLDGLVTQRSTETAVVVFEPRPVDEGERS